MLKTERILIFIEMHHHVTDFSTLLAHGVIGRAFEIADFRIALEHAEYRNRKLGLACTFLAIDIEKWE